jgi:uncharacterized protein (DUF1330 family)
MSAYVVTDLEVFDIEHYLAYQQALKPLLEAAGARYLARGGEFRVYEGDYLPRRLIVLEFPSLGAIDDFYSSDAYLQLENQRRSCSSARIIAVDGL